MKKLCAHTFTCKRLVFIPIPKKGCQNTNECSNYYTICSLRMLATLCSKSFKLGFSSMWTENFQIHKLGFEELEEPEIKLPISFGSWRKQGSSRKSSTSVSLTMLKPLIVWITTKYGKFLKRSVYQTTLHVSWETYMQVKKQQLQSDMEQPTCSKLGKKYNKAVYCHSAYLILCRVHLLF